jgi:hypothetical protein
MRSIRRFDEGSHMSDGPNATEQIAITHFEATRRALYDLVGLFVTGPLKKEAKRPEVRAAIAALAQVAKDREGAHD